MRPKAPGSSARVEIDCETLMRLLAKRQMHLCELRCLDAESKQVLRRLGLVTCLQACHCKQN
jgi:hypothetical protein